MIASHDGCSYVRLIKKTMWNFLEFLFIKCVQGSKRRKEEKKKHTIIIIINEYGNPRVCNNNDNKKKSNAFTYHHLKKKKIHRTQNEHNLNLPSDNLYTHYLKTSKYSKCSKHEHHLFICYSLEFINFFLLLLIFFFAISYSCIVNYRRNVFWKRNGNGFEIR